LLRNKMRSVLTVLGIMIDIGAAESRLERRREAISRIPDYAVSTAEVGTARQRKALRFLLMAFRGLFVKLSFSDVTRVEMWSHEHGRRRPAAFR
jgi:hypothetical protein